VDGQIVHVRVHSLGAKATGGGQATVVANGGRVVATATLPPLSAPRDLTPRTATVNLSLPAGARLETLTVRVALPGSAREVTMLNNTVRLPATR